MADMPDLDTTNVSFTAYYNVIDNTSVDSINPETAISGSKVVSSTVYDNGVVLEYLNQFSEFPVQVTRRDKSTVRIKTDGWVVVTVQTGTEGIYDWNNVETIDGEQNMFRGFYQKVSDFGTLSNYAGRKIISDIVSYLDNSSTIEQEYNGSDVGLWNYNSTSATNTTVGAHNSSNGSAKLVVTNGTTVHDFYAYSNTLQDSNGASWVDSGGTEYTLTNDEAQFGIYNVKANNKWSAGNEVGHNQATVSTASFIITWS